MLDAGLAARQLPGIDAASTAGLVGFSQGGHAALFAAGLAPEWAPELSMFGVVLGAPATEISTLARSGAERSEEGALTVSILAGLAATYPEARGRLSDVLTPAGIELLDLLGEHCFDESVPSMPSPPFVAADPTAVEPFASLLAVNNAGHASVAAPMLVFHGDDDRSVPFTHSEAMAAAAVRRGTTARATGAMGRRTRRQRRRRVPRRRLVAGRPRRPQRRPGIHVLRWSRGPLWLG